MHRFCELYARLDETTKTQRKVRLMAGYFASVPAADAAWAFFFLSGRRLKRLVPVRRLAAWASQQAELPDWLFEQCYAAVGDLAETIALVLPEPGQGTREPLHAWVEQRCLPLASQTEDQQRATLMAAWQELTSQQRFVWNKLLTGGFRVGVSQGLVVRAVAELAGLEAPTLEHRLMGHWQPSATWWTHLLDPGTTDADISQPYPFFLAHPLEESPAALGSIDKWQAEWKWDGIRAQLVRRRGQTFLWSRGEELVTERYQELHPAAELLPDGTVLDFNDDDWRSYGTDSAVRVTQPEAWRSTIW